MERAKDQGQVFAWRKNLSQSCPWRMLTAGAWACDGRSACVSTFIPEVLPNQAPRALQAWDVDDLRALLTPQAR